MNFTVNLQKTTNTDTNIQINYNGIFYSLDLNKMGILFNNAYDKLISILKDNNTVKYVLTDVESELFDLHIDIITDLKLNNKPCILKYTNLDETVKNNINELIKIIENII